MRDKVKPYACDIWNSKIMDPDTNLIDVTAQEVVLTLLPRTVGKFTRYGLVVNKLRYHCDGYKEAYLKGGKCTVSYNPDDAGKVWLQTEDGTYDEFKLIEAKYNGMTFSQVSEQKLGVNNLVRKEQGASLQAKIDLLSFIETAAEQKDKPADANIKGIRDNRKAEKHRSHEDIGGVLKDG